MRACLAFALLFVTACGEVYPLNEPADPPALTERAVRWIDEAYTDAMGEPELGRDIAITWYLGDCLEGLDTGTCVRGATITTAWGTEVALLRKDSIHHSALAHELLHVWGGDADHTDPEWAIVPYVNLMLRDGGM